MNSNILYFYYINSIGGVETFLYYLAKKYGIYDITVYYSYGDEKQIERLKKRVRVKKYKEGEKIKCKKAFFNYEPVIIDNVEAKEYSQIIHANYKELNKVPILNSKITRYIGVSKLVCESFEELTGKKCELCYNPIELDEVDEPLLIVSATRLTEEKGKENIVRVGKKLNKLGRPYIWLIFTNDEIEIDNPNIIYMKPRLNIIDYLKKADIVAQLSNSEAFGFTPNEALIVGTPVLLMDLPIWKELGIKNGIHGWIIKDINEFDVNKLYNPLPEFKYQAPKDRWEDILEKDKSNYKEEMNMKYLVEALDTYEKNNLTDYTLGRIPKEGERFEVTKERLDVLLGENDYKFQFVKIVKKLSEEIETADISNDKVEKPKKTVTKGKNNKKNNGKK